MTPYVSKCETDYRDASASGRKSGARPPQNAAGRRLMTTLHLLYNEDQQLALKDLMEKFKNEAQELGVDLKASTFEDV